MTNDQWAALAELMRLQPATPSAQAVESVLVHGAGHAEAARALGLNPQTVRNAVSRARRALALAETAAGMVK